MSAELRPARVSADHRVPCSRCSHGMSFDPVRAALVCDSCGHVAEFDDRNSPWRSPGALLDFDVELAASAQTAPGLIEETRTVVCTGCEAQVEFDAELHDPTCPFCGTPTSLTSTPHRQIRPAGLAPFELDEAAARAALRHWLGQHAFAPRGLKALGSGKTRLQGIYMPYWVIDATTRSRYSGRCGTLALPADPEADVTEDRRVRWQPAEGLISRRFSDILFPGSLSLPQQMIDGLAPWNLSHLEPYKPEYLAGLRMQVTRTELADAFAGARSHMDRIIARDVRFDIGGDRQRIDTIDTVIGAFDHRQVLLPVWLGTYTHGGRLYRIAINGQSGRVLGTRPMDHLRAALVGVSSLALATGLATALPFTSW